MVALETLVRRDRQLSRQLHQLTSERAILQRAITRLRCGEPQDIVLAWLRARAAGSGTVRALNGRRG